MNELQNRLISVQHEQDGNTPRLTLLMLSGGFDSVYTLYKLLTETDDYVIAHHIHLVNPEERHLAEKSACRAIVEWLRSNVRHFDYSESSIDHRGLVFFGADVMSVGFEAGIVAHSIYAATGKMPDRWTVGTCLEEGHNTDRWPHVEACIAANCYPNAPPAFELLPMVTKAQEIEAIPEALAKLVWYCRRPVAIDPSMGGSMDPSWKSCGQCKTCKTVAEARRANVA